MTAEERAQNIAMDLLRLAVESTRTSEVQVFEAILTHIRAAESDARREALEEAAETIRLLRAHETTGLLHSTAEEALADAVAAMRALAAKEARPNFGAAR